jgi:hypothetical protein
MALASAAQEEEEAECLLMPQRVLGVPRSGHLPRCTRRLWRRLVGSRRHRRALGRGCLPLGRCGWPGLRGGGARVQVREGRHEEGASGRSRRRRRR